MNHSTLTSARPETPPGLLPLPEYVRQLKPMLPAEAFRARPDRLLFVALHTLVIVAAVLAIRFSPSWVVYPFASVVIGHSMACIAFVAHDLSHNSVVRGRRLRYLCELYCWGLLVVPTTIWHRLHNQTHHRHANSAIDPDRRFFSTEQTRLSRLYDRLFIPSANSRGFNLVPFAFFAYMTRAVIAAFFYPQQAKPSFVTYNPGYTWGQRGRIVFELLVSFALQFGLFQLAGGEWGRFVWASLVPLALVTSLLISYIVTNHFLNPATEINDPLANSTSLEVPALIDRMHHHFSHHTEHHIFPAMSSAYYPLVRAAIREKYPERFHCLSFGEATHRVWRAGRFLDSEAPPAG